MPMTYYLILSGILFTLGIMGVILRRNAIIVFMSLELMFNAANILFVALGVPRQEKWLRRYAAQLHVPVAMGVGGTFDVMAGQVTRAPQWMQRAGLEWLYRLLCQPSRCLRMLALPRFVWHVCSRKNS